MLKIYLAASGSPCSSAGCSVSLQGMTRPIPVLGRRSIPSTRVFLLAAVMKVLYPLWSEWQGEGPFLLPSLFLMSRKVSTFQRWLGERFSSLLRIENLSILQENSQWENLLVCLILSRLDQDNLWPFTLGLVGIKLLFCPFLKLALTRYRDLSLSEGLIDTSAPAWESSSSNITLPLFAFFLSLDSASHWMDGL